MKSKTPMSMEMPKCFSPEPDNSYPLTLDQLRHMDGRPAYWPDDESWGIISVDDAGRWAGIPFFRGRKNGVNFEFNIVSRGMEVYAYPPTHIDREAWETCQECKPSCNSCENNPGDTLTVPRSCANCVGYRNYKPENKFCCECGRPLTEEAWAELERRIFGE